MNTLVSFSRGPPQPTRLGARAAALLRGMRRGKLSETMTSRESAKTIFRSVINLEPYEKHPSTHPSRHPSRGPNLTSRLNPRILSTENLQNPFLSHQIDTVNANP